MNVKPAKVGARGIDCITVLNTMSSIALKSAKVDFVVRYLGSLTSSELTSILSAGLAFMPVTFSRAPGWIPTPGLGVQDGNQDIQHLQQAGVPKLTTVWIDLEGCHGMPQETSQWVNDRAGVLLNAGYVPGIYVGDDQPLSAEQLNALRTVRYWHSGSRVPEPAVGYCMYQLLPFNQMCGGVQVDLDFIQADRLGRVPNWVEAA